jgi:thiopurine S-methyltransferase
MDASFWLQAWQDKHISFHKGEPNPLLVKYFNELSLPKGTRVFLPLCGKSLDISWLLSEGYRVAGAELSKIAVEELFAQLGAKPGISRIGDVDRYSARNLDIFVGDIFALPRKVLGPVDATYDRAALVALPERMRTRYTAHLKEITDQAPQLLICYEYDQSQMEGPPFSVSNQEVHRHYRDSYQLTLLESTSVPGGLKGKCAANENVWLLKKIPGAT